MKNIVLTDIPFLEAVLCQALIIFIVFSPTSPDRQQVAVFYSSMASSVGYWVGYILISFRRPKKPTKIDILYARFGVIPVVAIGSMLIMATWKWLLGS